MSQTLIWFLVGGAVVSAFVGDLLKPKSFAGTVLRPEREEPSKTDVP